MKTQNEILITKTTKELERLREINDELIKIFRAKYTELQRFKNQINNELLWRKRLG